MSLNNYQKNLVTLRKALLENGFTPGETADIIFKFNKEAVAFDESGECLYLKECVAEHDAITVLQRYFDINNCIYGKTYWKSILNELLSELANGDEMHGR